MSDLVRSPLCAGRVLVLVGRDSLEEGAPYSAVAGRLNHLCSERGWEVCVSHDMEVMGDGSLDTYDAIVLVNISGSAVGDRQRVGHERFRRQGGGTVVICAGERESASQSWPWYRDHVPTLTEAEAFEREITIVNQEGLTNRDGSHPATCHWPFISRLGGRWHRFTKVPKKDVFALLIAYDPLFYPEESPPLSWYTESQEGRYFYTALGSSLDLNGTDELVSKHLIGGVEWAAGKRPTEVHRSKGGTAIILSEFDGESPNGVWRKQAPSPEFTYSVTPSELRMHDSSAVSLANRHLVRTGIAIDPRRPYAIEGKVTIPGPWDAIKPQSFCCNLNVAGSDDDDTNVDTWSVPIQTRGENRSVTRIMGFLKGAFFQIGQLSCDWGDTDCEYSFRIHVNADLKGLPQTKLVSMCVKTGEKTLQEFEADYSSFPYQPDYSAYVRFGVNGHGTGWQLTHLKLYYLDVFD